MTNGLKLNTLRHRVTLKSLVPVQNPATGAVVDTWVDFATVWAAVEPLSVREFIAAQQTQSRVTSRIRILHLPGVVPSMRAHHGTHVYNIEGVLADKQSGKAYIILPVSEVISG